MTSVEPLAPGQLLEIFKKARLINLFDERMRSLLRSGKLMAVYYSPRGQEIVAAAMGCAFEADRLSGHHVSRHP